MYKFEEYTEVGKYKQTQMSISKHKQQTALCRTKYIVQFIYCQAKAGDY